MTIEKQPVEDVSPIDNGDFPLSQTKIENITDPFFVAILLWGFGFCQSFHLCYLGFLVKKWSHTIPSSIDVDSKLKFWRSMAKRDLSFNRKLDVHICIYIFMYMHCSKTLNISSAMSVERGKFCPKLKEPTGFPMWNTSVGVRFMVKQISPPKKSLWKPKS